MKAWIRMRSLDDVEKFLQIVREYPLPITLSLDRQRVDGKSRIGIFSLNLSRPLELTVSGACEGLLTALAPFMHTLARLK